MDHARKSLGAAAGVLAGASLIAFAPAAHAAPVDLGASRNDIGSYSPTSQPVPTTDSGGSDTGQIVLGVTVAVVLVGGAGTVIALRRRSAAHPA